MVTLHIYGESRNIGRNIVRLGTIQTNIPNRMSNAACRCDDGWHVSRPFFLFACSFISQDADATTMECIVTK